MKIYLAGPIFHCEDYECKAWREEAKKKLTGFDIIDPVERKCCGSTEDNFREIVEEGKALIDICDIVLVNHFKPSVGTAMEILYAWQNHKLVYVVSQSWQNSPWLIYHSHKMFSVLDDAFSEIKKR